MKVLKSVENWNKNKDSWWHTNINKKHYIKLASRNLTNIYCFKYFSLYLFKLLIKRNIFKLRFLLHYFLFTLFYSYFSILLYYYTCPISFYIYLLSLINYESTVQINIPFIIKIREKYPCRLLLFKKLFFTF